MADQPINPVPKAALALALLVLPMMTATALPAAASEAGQYIVTPVGHCRPGTECALIVDTKNGYVWQWDPSGDRANEPSLKYQGQVIPGKDSLPSGSKDPPPPYKAGQP